MTKLKLMYVYPSCSSFINSDVRILSKHYEVITQHLQWGSAMQLPLNLLRQFIFIVKNIRSVDAIVVSFAGYFSLLPVVFGTLFSKKTHIILNGTESVSFPEYNYGSLRKPLLRFFIKYSVTNASQLLPVDASLLRQEYTFDDSILIKKQGLLHHFPKLKTPSTVIPNGFDTDFWNFDASIIRPNHFMTVVGTSKKSTAIFKGIDLITKSAKKYPDKKFTIVGMSKEVQEQFDFTANVTLYSYVAKEELRELYQSHQFYMQLSINEGFGCALAEAMLCGCIPIVANSGALPRVAGINAFIVQQRTIQSVFKRINQVLKLSVDEMLLLSKNTRNHIVTNFSIELRAHKLLEILKV